MNPFQTILILSAAFLAVFGETVLSAPRELLGIEGPRFLLGAACVAGAVVAALPFLDRRGSKTTAWLAWFALSGLLLLAIHALD